MKVCDLKIVKDKCYYKLCGCSNDELINIINYKSWIYKSWKFGRERKYFSFVYSNQGNDKIVWSSIGFSPILVRYLQGLGYVVNGKEIYRCKEIIIGNTFYKLWDFQDEAIKVWKDRGCCGVIKAPTGSGKTTLTCDIIKDMKLKSIICVHTSDLLINAWYNELIKQFGSGIKSRLGIVGGGLSKKDRLRMRLSSDVSYKYNINKDIVIASTQTLLNHLDELVKERFGLVISDEVHRYPAEQFKKVLSVIRAPYRLGLSATLIRPDGMSPLIYGLIGDVVYKIGIKDLVKRGYLVKPLFSSIIINDEVTQKSIFNCGLKMLDLSRFIKTASASSVMKKNYIIKLVKSLVINNKKFIMYTDFVNKGKGNVFVRDDYVKELTDNKIKVMGISSNMSAEGREIIFKKLKDNKINGIIFGKLGSEGVNIPNIDSVIMCNSTKSTILFPQRVGRAMRITNNNKKNAFIYEILLNIPKELEWSRVNFLEYELEGYMKEYVNLSDYKDEV